MENQWMNIKQEGGRALLLGTQRPRLGLWKGLRSTALGQLFPLINFLLEEESLEKKQEDS